MQSDESSNSEKKRMKQYYSFTSTEYFQDPDELEVIGSRGRRVMELASLGAPISPGFILPSEVVIQLSEGKIDPKHLLRTPIEKMEKAFGKGFDDATNPLLIKVVESPMLNMVNTFSTLHNIGLTETTVEGFAKYVGEDFAYHEYANVVLKIMELELLTNPSKDREKKLSAMQQKLKKAKGKPGMMKALEESKELLPGGVYTNSYEQLAHVINLFHSLFQTNQTSADSALLIQTMVFGNFGKNSSFGDYYTHDIITGENVLRGEFFAGAFDNRAKSGTDINKIQKKYRDDLVRIGNELEKNFKEIRRVRFTIEDGRLWVIDQQPVPNKSAQAEIKTLLDLQKEGVVDEAYVINAIKPGRLSEILHPALDSTSVSKFFNVSGGIAGAVGAAIGRVFFSTDELIKAHRVATQKGEDTNFILAMSSTYAEDVKAIEVARGVLSTEGGYASHAPVVARSLGKVALVYPGISFQKGQMKIGQKVIKEGEYITLHVPYYDPPELYVGKGVLTKPTPEGSGLLELLELVQNQIDDNFDVRANADQPKDAELALKFKTTGIGLCRTEHMFFDEKRINKFRSMILADSTADRQKILNELRKMQVQDFYDLFKIMQGRPVTIRLLDAPLHEFLPHTEGSMKEFVSFLKKSNSKTTAAEVKARCDMLAEVNPMLGHRGCRIAISYPEIYNMQVSAIFEAAYKLKKEGVEAKPEIMVPLVMSSTELKTIRNGKKIEGKSIIGIRELEEEVRAKYGLKPIDYQVGTMIELPAAALQADRIARYGEFFSFGTNDLTQTTNGLSRDDFNNFFSDYNEFDLLEENPFKVLGEQVKELIGLASERGRLTRPGMKLGICGEHGAEPANIPFAKDTGMNYVSCSPYGIPIAKLAIAQLNLARKAEAAKAKKNM